MALFRLEVLLLTTVTKVYAELCYYKHSYYVYDPDDFMNMKLKYVLDFMECGNSGCCTENYVHCCPVEESINMQGVIFGSIFGVTVLIVCCGVMVRCCYRQPTQPTVASTQNTATANQADAQDSQMNVFALPPPSYEECVIKNGDTSGASYLTNKHQNDIDTEVRSDGLPDYKTVAALTIAGRINVGVSMGTELTLLDNSLSENQTDTGGYSNLRNTDGVINSTDETTCL